MIDSIFDWSTFGTGFLAALLIIALVRWRRGRRSPKDLTTPPHFPPTITNIPPDLRVEIRSLKMGGQLIHAIKLVRERTGCGLKEAKDIVDGVM